MPRRKPVPTAPPEARPAAGVVISPEAVYRLQALTALLGLRRSSLAREIRERRLKVVKRCGVYFFLGSDVLDWLRGGAVKADKAEGRP